MSSSDAPSGPLRPPENAGLDRRREANATPEPRPEPLRPIEPPRPGKKIAEVEKFPNKLSKKEKRALKDSHRPLDSWERYRALTDVLDEAIDLVDLADHKARFALVIMATLNVVLFFVGTRTDLIQDIPARFQPFIAIYLLVYVLVALYFFMQAIESLRPRKSQPQVPPVSQTGIEDFPLGIRFYEDILRRDPEEYKRAWKEVRMGQLNAELAVQSHALAGINRAKYGALRRLYLGLKIMTMLAVGLVGLAAAFTVVGTARKASKAAARGAKILGQAERIADTGVKEPSGVAFHAATNHLFVVGDEGSLVELDLAGKRLHGMKVEAQIEDLTVHPPTGLLVMLSESRSELILFDPVSRQMRGRFPIDVGSILDRLPGDRNQGFEGVTFRPQEGRPGGGVFYLTHQRSPAAVIALAFDPAGPPRRIGAESGVARYALPNFEDLTAITYVPSLDRLLVIADAKDRILVLHPDTAAIEEEIPLPGQQQEGLAFDSTGTLWVADDLDKSVLKIPGALEGLTKRLQERAGLSLGGEERPSPASTRPEDLLNP
jgi:uncharacterized protein YjiK